ncbi:hypothetical protein TNCV_1188621 [Trichonephila clavipes]|nr:hypothetical protein TNCV_1188621 [Trichonephila clavipes]
MPLLEFKINRLGLCNTGWRESLLHSFLQPNAHLSGKKVWKVSGKQIRTIQWGFQHFSMKFVLDCLGFTRDVWASIVKEIWYRLPSFTKILAPIVELISALHRLTPFADNYSHSAALPQLETVL